MLNKSNTSALSTSGAKICSVIPPWGISLRISGENSGGETKMRVSVSTDPWESDGP